jgi:hypothetical protein
MIARVISELLFAFLILIGVSTVQADEPDAKVYREEGKKLAKDGEYLHFPGTSMN